MPKAKKSITVTISAEAGMGKTTLGMMVYNYLCMLGATDITFNDPDIDMSKPQDMFSRMRTVKDILAKHPIVVNTQYQRRQELPYKLLHQGLMCGSSESYATLEEAMDYVNKKFIDRGDMVQIMDNCVNDLCSKDDLCGVAPVTHIYAAGKWWKVDNSSLSL